MQKTLTATAFKPSSPVTGDEQYIFRGQNMILEGMYPNVYYRAYSGSLDLQETAPTELITGTISFDPTTRTITGSGTVFLDELHLGQMLQASGDIGEVIVVGQLISQTEFVADRLPMSTETGATAHRLPIIGELNTKRFTLLRGNALHFDKGTIIAVGDGPLYVNGAPLPGDTLWATRQPQVALYDPITQTYDVEALGFSEVPTVANGDVSITTGGIKNMSKGYYSLKVAYYSDITSGYGNPTDTLLAAGIDGYNITSDNSQFVIDFTTDAPFRPAKATGYVIYGSAFSGSSDISKTNAIQGGWFEASRVAFTDLAANTYTFEYIDSDLATLVSFDNDTPPDAEFLGSIDLYPFLVSTDGQGVDSTGRESTTSPGPFVSPAKPDNLDAWPASYKVPTAKGENILGVVSAAGRFFVMTPNTLQAVTPTGLPAAPFTCRPFWKRGFVNPYNLIFIDDTLYGYSGKKLFRSTGTADEANESYVFASDVEAQLAESSGGYVFIGHDPKNECICVFLSAQRQNDSGFWETDVYPWSLTKSIWMPKIVLSSTEKDMVVSGVATVNNELCFVCGGSDVAHTPVPPPDPFDGFGARQWFRPEELSGYSDGAAISTWVDHSAYLTNGSGGQKPGGGAGWELPYTAPLCDTGQINGYPAAQFLTATEPGGDPIQSGLYFDLNIPSLEIAGWTAQEMVMVVRATGSHFNGSWDFAAVNNHSAEYPDTGDIWETFGAQSSTNGHTFTPSGALTSWRIYQVTATTNDFKAWLDGALQYSNGSHSYGPGAHYIGLSNLSATPLFQPVFGGWVVEYILWAKQLTDPERASTLAYLQTKYGL